MSRSSPASSTSTDRLTGVAAAWAAMLASWRAKFLEVLAWAGAGGEFVTWIVFPAFPVMIIGLIYRSARPDLLGYVVVAAAANTVAQNLTMYLTNLLDDERINGTLVGLFLAPCPRYSWLIGFTLGGIVDTIFSAFVVLGLGLLAFRVPLHPDFPALIVTAILFLIAIGGLGFILTGLGLMLKDGSTLSNLVFPIFAFLGGVWYPVALLPIWLQIPARCLPLGYGMQALASAALHHTGVRDLAAQLIPLTGFAIGLPILGIWMFSFVEKRIRIRGELDLY